MNKCQFFFCVFLLGQAIASAQTNSPETYFDDIALAKNYKLLENHNPLFTQRFGADPYAMVYNDEVYIYMTNDVLEYENGVLQDNSYSKINTINCISSKDMVNWTDHGTMKVAGRNQGPAGWASCSWAPTACHKEVDGKEKFFLYFANNGSGIGVVTSDCPWGPWTDPIGKELISRSTPNCGNVEWLFDPAVLVENDTTAYLYFGGGVPKGKEDDPGTARVAKLGSDFISVVGTPVTINPPYLFEDAGANKIAGKYIYSYCSNWNCPGNPMSNAQICYMTSDSPMGPFSYSGVAYANQAEFLGYDNGGNNHHSMFEFKGKWYMTYHGRMMQNEMGLPQKNYRSAHVDYVDVNTQTSIINKSKGSAKGVAQVESLNPFVKTEAETIAWMGGIDTRYGGSNMLVTDIDKGDWIGVSGVDFGKGASVFTACVSSNKEGAIKLCKGSPDGETIGYLSIPNTNGELKEVSAVLPNTISGEMDIFFIFSGEFEFDYWMFKETDISLVISQTNVEASSVISLSIATSESDIASAEYYLDGESIGMGAGADFSLDYTVSEIGLHEVMAVVKAADEKTFKTQTATLTVREPKSPFGGIAQTIPGTIEMEKYDAGGQGYAYYDVDAANQGNVFRPDEGVDLDVVDDGGYVLGWTMKGEWIEYTVEVKKDGIYIWKALVASELDHSAFSLYLDGEMISDGSVEVPNTKSWANYLTVSGKTPNISKGNHILKVCIDGDYVNIDNIKFESYTSTGVEDIANSEQSEYDIFSAIGTCLGSVFSYGDLSNELKEMNYAKGTYIVRSKRNGNAQIIIVK